VPTPWFNAEIAKEDTMIGRKYVDCREVPSVMHCTMAMSADSEEELLEAAVQHAVTVHKHQDTPELRAEIRKSFREGTPPLVAGGGQTADYLRQELEDDE
jgi:predicted small metal-binding protein